MIAAPAAKAESVESDPNVLAAALAGMGDEASARMRKVLSLYLVASTAATLTRRAVKAARNEWAYLVTVESDDDIYPDVQQWLLERMPSRRQRALVARTGRRNEIVASVGGDLAVSDLRTLRLHYDGRRVQTVRLEGHRVKVSIEQQEYTGQNQNGPWRFRPDRIVFTGHSIPARDAVVALLNGMAEARGAQRQPRVMVCSSWGEWHRSVDQPLRPLTSVILREGQREDLVDDLQRFLAAEGDYNRLGLPWHRGYLLEGPPGTGKTSFAKAVARDFDLDVYFIPLATLPNDGAFMRVLASVPPRSLLLIEDIDIAHGARQRDDSDPGVTLSGLLNGLDGVMTPHGMVVFLTTNDEDVIDDALLRPGRVDMRMHLGHMDDDQFRRLVAYGLDRPAVMVPPLGDHLVTPAATVEVLKAFLDRPDDVFSALQTLVLRSPRAGVTARR